MPAMAQRNVAKPESSDSESSKSALRVNGHRRIVTELFAPPFLAALVEASLAFGKEPLSDILGGFIPTLQFAYVFGIVPAILYTAVMELWFRLGFRARCGLLCTAGLSGLLGVGAGYLSAWFGIWLGFLTRPEAIHYAKLGALIGLLIGFFVAGRVPPGEMVTSNRRD